VEDVAGEHRHQGHIARGEEVEQRDLNQQLADRQAVPHELHAFPHRSAERDRDGLLVRDADQ